MDLTNASILITGGTGSLGKKLVDLLLNEYNPRRIIIFSRDELKQSELRRLYPPELYPSMRYYIGDVRNKERLDRAFHGVDYVIHAAAMKQVDTAEANPFEVIQTNILGAKNIIDAAIDNKVKKVIGISTDKAVNPINLYGATKLCSDKVFISGNIYSGMVDTVFSVVRYGNVMGSRGSVIPFFRSLVPTGVLPITDLRMTRFWITLEQAARFVLKCLAMTQGGEIFIPKIPSMKIVDLANAIGPNCELKPTKKRPGEKLHEALIAREDASPKLEYDDFYVILPEYQWCTSPSHTWDISKSLPEDYGYYSNTNTHWLTVSELRNILLQHDFSEEQSIQQTLPRFSPTKKLNQTTFYVRQY
ncbi:MAG: UDP-N-acetylglucosamine 4,6-dehydratase (inverting) [bacterium]|nr:UDP-N-acetylglucosamine 4,6-dehydratase (inverting) [bacterium]